MNASLRYRDIHISAEAVGEKSDFWLKFMVASEIIMAQSVDHVSGLLASRLIYPFYQEPTDPLIKNSIKATVMGSIMEGLPASTMAAIWSYYLMLPDYNLAVDSGKIVENSEDWGGSTVFKRGSERFKKEGLLLKNSQNRYEWLKTQGQVFDPKVYEAWLKFSTELMEESRLQKSLNKA